MTRLANPLPPANALVLGVWDALFAVRALELDHGEDCACAVCAEADRIGYLLDLCHETLESAMEEARGALGLTELTHHWEWARGRPIDHAAIGTDPNPASLVPRWARGEPNVPPAGTAAAWDAQFVSAPQRLMKALWKAQQANARVQAEQGEDGEFAYHAGTVMHLLEPLVNALENRCLGAVGEDWVHRSAWTDPDPEVGPLPAAAALPDIPVCVVDGGGEAQSVSALDLVEELPEAAAPPKEASMAARRAGRLLLFALRDVREACRELREARDHGKACACKVCFCLRQARGVHAGIREGLQGILGGPEGVRDTLRKRLGRRGKMIWVLMALGESAIRGYSTRGEAEEELEAQQREGLWDDVYLAAFPHRFYELNEGKPWAYFDALYARPFEE